MKRQLIFMLAVLGMVLWLIGCKEKDEAKHEVVTPPVYTPPSVTIQPDREMIVIGQVVHLEIGIVRGSNTIAGLEIGFQDSTRTDTVLPTPQGDTLVLRHCYTSNFSGDNYPVVRVNDGAAQLQQAACHVHVGGLIDDPPYIHVTAPDTAWVGDSALIRIRFGRNIGGTVIDSTLSFGDPCGGTLDRMDTLNWDDWHHELQLKWHFSTSGLCPFVATIGSPVTYCPPTDTSTSMLADTAIIRVLQH